MKLKHEAIFPKVCLNRLPSVALFLHEKLQLLNIHGSFLPVLTGYWAFMCSDIEIETGCFYLKRQSQLLSLQTCPGHRELKVSQV